MSENFSLDSSEGFLIFFVPLQPKNKPSLTDRGYNDRKHYEKEYFKVYDDGPDGLCVYHLHGLWR